MLFTLHCVFYSPCCGSSLFMNEEVDCFTVCVCGGGGGGEGGVIHPSLCVLFTSCCGNSPFINEEDRLLHSMFYSPASVVAVHS